MATKKTDANEPEAPVYDNTTNVTDGQEVTKSVQVTDEVPQEVAPKTHQPYEDKPATQVINETLTPETPTGYAKHTDVNLGKTLDDTIAAAHAKLNAGTVDEPKEEFSYTDGWDTGFAQDGDPYGIQKEYISQSFNPNAVKADPVQPDTKTASVD